MRALIRTHPFQTASAVVMMVLLGTTAYLVVTLIDTRSDQSNTAADVRIIKASPCTADPASRACGRLRRAIAEVEPVSVPCTSLRRVMDPGSLGRLTISNPPHNPEQNGSTNESGGNDATDPSDGPAPGPGPSDPSGGDSGGDPGDGGGGVADDPPATDPPPAGGGGGENPRPPDGGGDPPALSPPTADPSPPTLGETIDGATGTVCGITGPLPVVCPPRGVGQ